MVSLLREAFTCTRPLIFKKNLPDFPRAIPSQRGCKVWGWLVKKGKFTNYSFDDVIFLWKVVHLIAHQTSRSLCWQTGDCPRCLHCNFVFINPGDKAAIFSFCTSAHDKLFLFPLIHFLLFFENISCFLSLVLLKINPCQDSAQLSGD